MHRLACRLHALRLMILPFVLLPFVISCELKQDLKEPKRSVRPATILSSDGSTLGVLPAPDAPDPIGLAEVAPVMIAALLATEDHRYYTHDGVDLHSMSRALKRNVEAGDVVEGGSTITQQYVRNVLLSEPTRSKRKLKEVTMAIELDDRLRKNQVLERYLNAVYFGDRSYGIQRAAMNYFGIPASDLQLDQAALLAGLLQAPSNLEPRGHADAAVKRRNVVLTRMAELGYITEATASATRKMPLSISPPPPPATMGAPFFVDRVVEWFLQEPAFGETEADRRALLTSGGLKITTTLDPKLQLLAETAVQRAVGDPSLPTAALVAIDPRNGAVRAYVGGRDYYGDEASSQFDTAGTGQRSPGSTFKTFVLAAALADGVPLSRTFSAPGTIDLPIPGQPDWHVQNYDGEGGGKMNLLEATVSSVNTVFAQLVLAVGASRATEMATALGVSSPLDPDPAVALGGTEVTVLDMAHAYATLANDGVKRPIQLVDRVTDGDGNVVWEAPNASERVLDETVARQVNDVLGQVVARGTGVQARIGRPIAGKTGTSEAWGDAWFVGSTPQLTVATWVGFPDAVISMVPPTTPITISGGTWPAEIFQSFMAAAMADIPVQDFPVATLEDISIGTPTLLGLETNAAQKKLKQSGIPFTVETRPSLDGAKGIVVAQRPVPGSDLQPGDSVTITVSSGRPKPVAVASVLGMDPADAQSVLEEQGFGVQIVTELEQPPPPFSRLGKVWKQSILPGATADVGLTITLTANPESEEQPLSDN